MSLYGRLEVLSVDRMLLARVLEQLRRRGLRNGAGKWFLDLGVGM